MRIAVLSYRQRVSETGFTSQQR